jgi:hypothetical protein
VLAAIQLKGYAHFSVKNDVWFVAFDGTIRELAEATGIRAGETGSGVVCPIAGYSGRLPKEAWDWLGVHEAQSE